MKRDTVIGVTPACSATVAWVARPKLRPCVRAARPALRSAEGTAGLMDFLGFAMMTGDCFTDNVSANDKA